MHVTYSKESFGKLKLTLLSHIFKCNELIERCLPHKVFAVLPTAYGRSLCYMLALINL